MAWKRNRLSRVPSAEKAPQMWARRCAARFLDELAEYKVRLWIDDTTGSPVVRIETIGDGPMPEPVSKRWKRLAEDTTNLEPGSPFAREVLSYALSEGLRPGEVPRV